MQIYAHRGWSSRYPENTLLAFAEAVALGVSGIELDIQLSRDGVPVVIHDPKLARTTNGNGLVDELDLSELRTLDAGAGERVPTLREVLDLVGDSVHLDIEIKAPIAGNAVLAELGEFPHARWVISSFDWHVLRELRQVDETIELWPLAVECDESLLAVASELHSAVVALDKSAYSEDVARTLGDAGLRALLWTVNDIAEADRVERLGAFALCTDDPSQFINQGLVREKPAAR